VLSPLELADASQVEVHVRALRVAAASRHLLPLLQRVLHHTLNRGIFNDEVDPVALNIPDYRKIIRHPMDLGTVKQKLLAALYKNDREFANDVRLVFANAIRYNPPTHFVHALAKQMATEFEAEFAKVVDRRQLKRQQERAHECSLCQGHTCPLCGEKCLKFDPPVMHCAGTCNQTIRRSALYHSAPDGLRHWCQRCYNSLPAVVPAPLVTKGQGSVTELRKRDLMRMRCDEEVAEPWVQCDCCERWVHQTCALFNLRKQSHLALEGHGDVEYRCALCCAGENSLLEDAGGGAVGDDEKAEVKLEPSATAGTSRGARAGKGRPTRMASPRNAAPPTARKESPAHPGSSSSPPPPPLSPSSSSSSCSSSSSPSSSSSSSSSSSGKVASSFAAAAQDATQGGRKGILRLSAPKICKAPNSPLPSEQVEAKLKPAEPIAGLPPDMCASALPGSVMGDFIEKCVCQRLHKLGEGAMASTVSVRVVSNIDRTAQVCALMCLPHPRVHPSCGTCACAAPPARAPPRSFNTLRHLSCLALACIRFTRWSKRTLAMGASATRRSSTTAPRVFSCSRRSMAWTSPCSQCMCRNAGATARHPTSARCTSHIWTPSGTFALGARARRSTTRS
jgi:hypothetical protein